MLTASCAVVLQRLLHLSKLFMLFQFNDFGAWFSFSRWWGIRLGTGQQHNLQFLPGETVQDSLTMLILVALQSLHVGSFSWRISWKNICKLEAHRYAAHRQFVTGTHRTQRSKGIQWTKDNKGMQRLDQRGINMYQWCFVSYFQWLGIRNLPDFFGGSSLSCQEPNRWRCGRCGCGQRLIWWPEKIWSIPQSPPQKPQRHQRFEVDPSFKEPGATKNIENIFRYL